MFILTGKNEGVEWTIQGRESIDNRFYALVTVGTTKKVTNQTFKSEEQAKTAGCQLMADTLAELVDARNEI